MPVPPDIPQMPRKIERARTTVGDQDKQDGTVNSGATEAQSVKENAKL